MESSRIELGDKRTGTYDAATVSWQSRLVIYSNYVYVPIAILVIWEFSARAGLINRHIIPSPSMIAIAWYDWAFGTLDMLGRYSGTWSMHLTSSARRVLIGFTIDLAVAIPLGVAVGSSRTLERIIDPTLQVIRPIPITSWLPLSMAFFGIKDSSAIFLIFLGGFFAIFLNTVAGVKLVDKTLIQAGQMLGCGPADLFVNVVLRAALPSVFTGMRISLGMAWMAVIVSEMVAVKSGIGYVLWDAYYYMRMDLLVATMLTVGALGFLSDRVLVLIADRTLRWAKGGGMG